MFLMALEDREILVMVISWIALAALIRVSGQLGRARFWALGAGTALVVALVATNRELSTLRSPSGKFCRSDFLISMARTLRVFIALLTSQVRQIT